MTDRPPQDLDMIRRQNEVSMLYETWPAEEPDDDLAYVARVREIMGLPPLPAALPKPRS